MAAGDSDDVVLRMVLRGIDPAEAARLAAQTASAIENELRASVGRQAEAFANAQRVMSEQGRFYAKQEVAEAQKKTQELAAAAKILATEQTSAAKRTADAMTKEARRAAAEQAAAGRAAATAAKIAAAEVAQAQKAEERAALGKLRAAKQADAEIQRMGRVQAAAIAENARRDERAAEAFAIAERKKAREAEIAANKVKNSWHRTMEDLENFTIVAQGAWGIISGGFSRFKALSEEIINTTSVFSSLKGSIDGARDAVQGTVSDMDLIISKNAAMSAGLELSDGAFADVAKAADAYGDAVGIGAKEAMDSAVNSLASGNVRFLKRIGILVDVKRAEEQYASVVEKTRDNLTEEEKRAAFAAAALQQIHEKNKQLTDSPPTFALVLEQGFFGAKNAWDGLVKSIGQFEPPAGFIKVLTQMAALARAYHSNSAMAMLPGGSILAGGAAVMDVASGLTEAQEAALGFNVGGQNFNRKLTPDVDEGDPDFLTNKKYKRGSRLPKAKSAELEFTGIDRLLDARDRVKAQQDATDRAENELAALQAERLQALIKKAEDQGGVKEGGAESMVQAGQFAQFGGPFRADREKDFTAAQAHGVTAGPGKEDVQAMLTGIGDTFTKVGGETVKKQGLISQLLYGDDEPKILFDMMSETEQETFRLAQSMTEAFSLVQGSGEAMAGALGQSLAAAIGENKNFAKMLKDTTHNVLMSLATQAFTRAAFETAEGLASLALGPIGGVSASAHFAAAAAFGGVGVLAGVGARATNSSSSSAGSTPASSRGVSSFAGNSSNRDDGGSPTNVTVVINGTLGDEVGVARSVLKAFDSYEQQTGRKIGARP